MRSAEVLFSSGCADWRTPPALYLTLNREFDFECDAAARAYNSLARHWLRDGLASPWQTRTFCNPPYGRELPHWIKAGWRNADEHGVTSVMLLPARTDTKAWHQFVMKADEIRLIPGRVTFWLSPEEVARVNAARAEAGKPPMAAATVAPFPSAVVVWRPFPSMRGHAPRVFSWTYAKG